MPNSPHKPSLLPWKLVAVFLLLAAGIGAAGYGYLHTQREHAIQEKQNDLAAIAGLKVRQIADWREDRFAEANSILATSFIVSHAQRWLASGGKNRAEQQALLAWMKAPRHSRHYRCIFLFDPAGEMRLASNSSQPAPCAQTRPAVQEAIRTQRVSFLDFHATQVPENVHLSLFVPLLAEANGKKTSIGVLTFEIDPHRFLYPLIQSWPTPSPSAETLLVRRDGDGVLYLNELRHGKAPAMSLRFPLTGAALPVVGVRAALGEEGSVEGRDYRGIEVLAALRKIPNSPWFMVTKIDRAEVEAPLRERVVLVVSISALLIVLSAFAVILLWRRQQLRFHLELYQLEEEVMCRLNSELEQRVEERTRDLQAEIAQHRRTESSLEKGLEDLAHSNADLEQFAFIASHDLQEPLRMVASFVQLLERRYSGKLDRDAQDFIGYAVEGVTRMQRLINDLLTFSLAGADSGDFEATDCNRVLAEVLLNLYPLIEENQALVTQDALPVVPAIATQIGQLLQNLIGNAVKFRRESPPHIHVSARRDGADWVFSVRDNGIGIAPEYFDKIFMIFKRLHSREKYAGTGIGLAICKRIAERHHGRIWVESEPGTGSTFYFTIPIIPEARDERLETSKNPAHSADIP